MMMYYCCYCNRATTNPGGNKKHEISCSKNPNKRKCGGNKKGYIPWNTGKKLHYTVGTKGKPGSFRGRTHSEETRQKMSQTRNKLYADGWEATAGRCTKYQYTSPIAGKVSLDGSWELAVVNWLDENQLTWRRNKKRFSYFDVNKKKRFYTPDFYIDEWNSYLEIKGYETELDRSKWSCFPEKLIIWKKEDLQARNIIRRRGRAV